MALISKSLNVSETVKVVQTQSQSQKKVVQTQSTPDDKKVIQQITETHSPDGIIPVDENVLLSMAQDILTNATPTLPLDPQKVPEDKPQQGISDELAFTIHKIGCELSCNCSGSGDMKSITLAVFKALAKYSWEDKVVIALSSFAVNYGEFCLLSQLHATNSLAKYVVQLKPLPGISEREPLISALLKVVIDVAKSVIELNDLPIQYISRDKSPFSDAQISNAVYWAIKGIVACSSESTGLMNIGLQYMVSITDARKKLTDLTQTLMNIHVHLTNILDQCYEEIKKKKTHEGYYQIKKLIESTAHTDSIEILIELIRTKELIHTKDDLPLFYGVTKERVGLNVLKSKTVVLFISYLDISDEDIKDIVQQVGKPATQFELVWLPIIDEPVVSKEMQDEILRKASLMPWHSLHYSFTLQPYVVKYIKEDWYFEKKPVLVVFDAQGKVVNTNAYHMIMTWGSAAYPFDNQRVENLLEESKWSLEFLINGADTDIETWVKEGRVIYLYGGDDLDWIRNFTSTVKEVVKGEGIILELIYVGKKHTETILKENLSKCWDELKIRQFRARLESLWYSKMQLGKTIADDTTLKQLHLFLGSNGSGEGWTITAQGSKDIVVLDGKMSIESLLQLKRKKVTITIQNFITTVYEVIEEVNITFTSQGEVQKHCLHIPVLNTNGIIPENMVCAKCNRPMEKVIMFKCCVE